MYALKSCPALARSASVLGVVCVKKAGVVQVFVDPCLQIFELTKVDDEAVHIGLAAGEGHGDAPIVPMDEGAMAFV